MSSSGFLEILPKDCWPRYGRLIAPQAVFVMVAALFAILEHNKNEGWPALHWGLAVLFIATTGVSHSIAKSICNNSNIGAKTLLATNGWIVLVMIGLTVYIIKMTNSGGGHGSVVKKQQPKVKISEGVSPATQNSTTGAANQNSTTGAANPNSTTGAAKANNGYLGRNRRRVCAHLPAGEDYDGCEALVDECNDDNDDWLSPMEQKNCEGKGLGAYLD